MICKMRKKEKGANVYLKLQVCLHKKKDYSLREMGHFKRIIRHSGRVVTAYAQDES